MKRGDWDCRACRMKGIVLPVCFAVVTLTGPRCVLAREITLGGGMSVGYEFDDRTYEKDEVASTAQQQRQAEEIRKNNNDERYSRLRLSPLITLTSTGQEDVASLRYAPSFWRDFEISDNDWDHDLLATLEKYLTKDWTAKLSEQFRRTDTVENQYGQTEGKNNTTSNAIPISDGQATLSDTNNRRKFWTNNLAFSSEYEYRQDSAFTVGYRYDLLRNIKTNGNTNYEDFDRHEVLSELSHRLNSTWKAAVLGSYVRGLFDNFGADSAVNEELDENKDLSEYRAAGKVEENYIDHHVHSLGYSYYGAVYDSSENADSSIHDVTLGWRWDVTKHVVYTLMGGPTYVKTEGAEGEWGYNASTSLSYAIERGLFELSAKHGYEILNFTGTNENGLRKFWQARFKFSYQLLEKLTTDLYADYRYEDENTITTAASASSSTTTVTTATGAQTGVAADTDSTAVTGSDSFNRKRVSTGISFGYSFMQWYKLSLTYDYSHQDSELVNDSFDENRVAVVLAYETDFLKW